MHLVPTFGAPAPTQAWTTFGSPEPVILVTGKGQISDSNCPSQNMPGIKFLHSKAFKISPSQGVSKILLSSIIWQSCDNFSYRISDSDCPSQNKPGINFSRSKAFTVSLCQGLPKNSHLALFSNVATISNIGYQIQIARFQTHQGPSFPALWLLSEFLFNYFVECAASPEVLTDGGRIQRDVVQSVTLLTAWNWEVWKGEAKVSLMHYSAWEFNEKEEERRPEEERKLSWRDRYVPGENLGLFICRVKRSAERLREVGNDLPPLYQGYQMIRSLPDDFRLKVQAIYGWSNKDFVPDKIEAELLLEENRRRCKKGLGRFATSKNKSVHGLPELSGLTENCIPCKLAKSRRVSFKPIGKIRSKRAQELLYMDLCSPLPVASQGVIGIDHEFLFSEMNGVAERYNLTALDGIKTLLNESGISQKFWAEALICFSYTWNRACHKGCKKTPFESYGGKRPSISHIKRFGCLVFVGVSKQLRRKLDMRAKLGMLGHALSIKGYRIWLIEENKVVETFNLRFDEGKRGVDSEKTFTGPVRNYLLKDFPEDGDIFSTVGDRADHPETGSERDTRPGGAGSESQTRGTHTLRPCASIPWICKLVERKDRSRMDIYYFVEGSNVRLRSFNEVQKYCKDKNIDYDQNLFNFSGRNSPSGKVTDLLNLPLEEKANLAEV
ncbi:retrovirus-related Pol polyprotein from transposon TNT 1-94 [Trichonephila clavipes]|nr:retrovirus-related Pol polyprotein from transposon TNT 1-94 [Trichonephila clavipes]